MTQFDAETNKQLSRADAINAMLQSSGWQFAEADLMEYVTQLKDISGIDLNAEDVVQQIRDRRNTAACLESWLDDLKSQVNNAIIIRSDEKGPNLVERR